jgi:hypothetical protein
VEIEAAEGASLAGCLDGAVLCEVRNRSNLTENKIEETGAGKRNLPLPVSYWRRSSKGCSGRTRRQDGRECAAQFGSRWNGSGQGEPVTVYPHSIRLSTKEMRHKRERNEQTHMREGKVGVSMIRSCSRVSALSIAEWIETLRGRCFAYCPR